MDGWMEVMHFQHAVSRPESSILPLTETFVKEAFTSVINAVLGQSLMWLRQQCVPTDVFQRPIFSLLLGQRHWRAKNLNVKGWARACIACFCKMCRRNKWLGKQNMCDKRSNVALSCAHGATCVWFPTRIPCNLSNRVVTSTLCFLFPNSKFKKMPQMKLTWMISGI